MRSAGVNSGEEKAESEAMKPLRVAFLGRLDPAKGVGILVHALKAIPEAKITLDIYGIAQGDGGEDFAAGLRTLAEVDSRIMFRPPIPASQVVEALCGHDLLAVPSQGLETGPLVVLEAFAARVPVLGSRLGGIAELVRDGVNGLLVEAANATAWAAALLHLCETPELMARLRAGISPPRTMATVAEEMAVLYGKLLSASDSRPNPAKLAHEPH